MTTSAELEACRECPLWETACRAVPGDGPVPARWLIVGEAPGRNEDSSGRPFVGAAGRKLNTLLEKVALVPRNSVYVTNLVKHWPPKNRKPRASEVRACLPFLEEEIEAVHPEVIITLGDIPLKWLAPGLKLPMEHGKARLDQAVILLPMYHPAAALHKPSLWPIMVEDWSRIHAEIAGAAAPPLSPVYRLATGHEVRLVLESV